MKLNEKAKWIRAEIVKLLDSAPKEGYREFLEEVAADVEARVMCLDDEESEDDHG